MEKNEFRAVIKHLHMKGLTPKEIKAELDNVHSTSAPAFVTIYNWVNLNVVVHPHDARPRALLRQKSSIKSTILF